MTTYSALQSEHMAALPNTDDFKALPVEQQKHIRRHPRHQERTHAIGMKKAAEWGSERVMADHGGFIQAIIESLAGWLLPVIGPIIARIVGQLIIDFITKQFLNKSAGEGSQSLDDMLQALAVEAGSV